MDLPAEPRLRWILSHTAAILELGVEPVRGLVLPTAEFFPDRFDGTPRSVAALMARIQGHAGLSDLKVDLTLVTPEGEAQKVNCASGACGTGSKIDTLSLATCSSAGRLGRIRRVRRAEFAGRVARPLLPTIALLISTRDADGPRPGRSSRGTAG